jgi:hypothetical protein
MGVESHSLNFNELKEPYVGRSYHVQIKGGHYIISICQEPNCTCPNWNFTKPIRGGHIFSPCKHLYWIYNTWLSYKGKSFIHQATLSTKEVIELLAKDPSPLVELLEQF